MNDEKIKKTQFIGNEKFDISRFIYSQRRFRLLLAVIVKFSHKMFTISNFCTDFNKLYVIK